MTPARFTATRESLHMSQRTLAEVLGVHPNVVNRWERGATKIPPYMPYTLEGIRHMPASKQCLMEIREKDREIQRLRNTIEDALQIAEMEQRDLKMEPWASLRNACPET